MLKAEVLEENEGLVKSALLFLALKVVEVTPVNP
jgi:hypothetical protein